MIPSDIASFRADIHCHSDCSDGSDTPLEILDKARLAQLQGLSITDHDTILAYSPEFFSKARNLSIQILTGVEISTELDGVVVHVLGYGFDLQSGSFLEFLQNIQTAREKRNRAILAKLLTKKVNITEEELGTLAQRVGKKKSMGRPHIAHLMVEKGYVRSMQEACELYLKDGASCYVPGFKSTPLDAIEQIGQAHGKAVLAHPHFIKGNLLHKLLQHPFDGIECYYGVLHKAQEAPWIQIAKKKQWIATGGSDYHGTYKPHIALGSSWVDFATFEKLGGRGSD
jgi:predicted metal-dependent phosphoesterase TrpH